MYSTFYIAESDCMACTNVTLKDLGTLQGVFGAEIDRISGVVTVTHTDEVNRETIAEKLRSLGYPEIEQPDMGESPDYDEPSIWGCAL